MPGRDGHPSGRRPRPRRRTDADTMPTINKRFLLLMVLAAAALAGVVVGTHTVQARRIPDALRGQAERAAEAGKSDRAIHYLRQYLEFRPDDTDARERLA